LQKEETGPEGRAKIVKADTGLREGRNCMRSKSGKKRKGRDNTHGKDRKINAQEEKGGARKKRTEVASHNAKEVVLPHLPPEDGKGISRVDGVVSLKGDKKTSKTGNFWKKVPESPSTDGETAKKAKPALSPKG